MLNKFIGIGNLTKDPELKKLQSGKTVGVFTLAINLGKNDNNPLFIDIQTWDSVAINCSKFLKKGRKVFVEGKIAVNSWTSKSGEKKSKPFCKANIVTFLSTEQSSQPSQTEDKNNEESPQEKDLTEDDEELANIPF